MKDFALRHPILTFLLVDTLISGIVNIATAVAGANNKKTEEVTDHEPAGDIQ